MKSGEDKRINFSEHKGFLWRDLAPRNILLTDDKRELFLIDYEYLYKIQGMEKYKKMLLDINRKIWFGDVLSQRQISYLFSDITPQTVGINCYFKADEIEKNVLSKKIVNLEEKLIILNKTSLIERLHRYKGEKIYGHRIGRFLSDFVSAKNESKIYGILNVLDKISFSRFLLLVQRCIEVDSEEMLKEYYKKPILKRNLTMNFLNSLSLININKKYVLKIMEDFEIYL